jgi:hypothetical protein
MMTFDEKVWDHIVRKHGDKGVLSVDTLERSLGEENHVSDRQMLVGFFKRCASRKLGTFYNGRRGKPSRMAWLRLPRLIPQSEMIVSAITTKESVVRTVTQELPIRPGVVARFVVPEDLTPAEASRIAEFIKRLPLQAA